MQSRTLNASGTSFIDTLDRKSTRLNSSHSQISYAVFCLKKKKKYIIFALTIGEVISPSGYSKTYFTLSSSPFYSLLLTLQHRLVLVSDESELQYRRCTSC